MQAYTHFRSVFDVSPARPMENAWAAAVGEIRAWIARKEKNPLKGFFFKGGNWTAPAPTWARVETRALSDGGGTPEMWAVRYEHVDSDVKSRRWSTNIGVTQVGPQEWRISVELTHRLRPGFVGREPAAPQPSSPRLVTDLLDSRNWVARIGSMRLTEHPLSMKVGKAPDFAKVLTDVQRLVPIILVSCDRKTGVPKLDSATLSRALAGTASVYVCESPDCDFDLEHFVPLRFRSPNGTVRIYAPGVDFSQDWTSARHRFFTAKEIEEQGDDEIVGHIVRALTRSDAWRGLQSSITSIDDIDARIRERRLSELRSAGAGSLKEKQEMLALFESENEALVGEAKRLAEELEAEKEKRSQAEDSVARQEYELELARASVAEARAQVRAQKSALQAVLGLSAWPESAHDVAALAIKVSGERLVFTNEAVRSLQKSEFATCADAASVIWRCLRAMASDLHELLMEDLPAQQVADTFKNRTKFDLTWTESKETKRDNRLMAKRRLMHEGVELDITPHVKWGNTAPRLLRVHFCVDRDRKRLIIGHCGDHLDTYGTRRR
jgi:hypothetical protein